MQYQI